MSTEIQFLIKASEPFPEKVSKEILSELLHKIEKWDWLMECAIRNSVSPLIYYNLRLTGLFDELRPEYKEMLEKNFKNAGIRNLKLRSVFVEIARELLSHGINIIALKGIALQHELYSNPVLRPMIDIDILLRGEQINEALHFLSDLGCKTITYSESNYIDTLKHHFPPLMYKGVAIELHHSLFDSYDMVQIPLASVWEKSEIRQIEGYDVYVLEKHHQLLYLCHHVFSTLRGGTVKLIWYTDIVSFLRKNSASINWEWFKQIVNEAHASDSVFHTLGIVGYLFEEHIFEENIKFEINKYCPHPHEILFYIENFTINPELTHYYQKFRNIKSFWGKLRYLKNRLFPSIPFIQRKYQTSGFLSFMDGYRKETSDFIYLGIQVLLSKFKFMRNDTKGKE